VCCKNRTISFVVCKKKEREKKEKEKKKKKNLRVS
jgi:hypothetical protein